jgi:hypothetical protein
VRDAGTSGEENFAQWMERVGLSSAGTPLRLDLQNLWTRACQSGELEDMLRYMQQEEIEKAARQADDTAKYTDLLVRARL